LAKLPGTICWTDRKFSSALLQPTIPIQSRWQWRQHVLPKVCTLNQRKTIIWWKTATKAWKLISRKTWITSKLFLCLRWQNSSAGKTS
jgi:hypothetical protein